MVGEIDTLYVIVTTVMQKIGRLLSVNYWIQVREDKMVRMMYQLGVEESRLEATLLQLPQTLEL